MIIEKVKIIQNLNETVTMSQLAFGLEATTTKLNLNRTQFEKFGNEDFIYLSFGKFQRKILCNTNGMAGVKLDDGVEETFRGQIVSF